MPTTWMVLAKSVGRLARGLLPCLLVGVVAGPLLSSLPAAAQGGGTPGATPATSAKSGSAPTATPAASATTDIQVVPSERAAGAVRIEPVEEEYRIGTQDLIEVQVLGVQDLRRETRVNAKGLIGLPLIGAVRVQGLTAAEAEALIAGLYSKNYLQNPEVSVFVKEYTRQNVTIDGAVAKPGIYPLKGPTTLMQALERRRSGLAL